MGDSILSQAEIDALLNGDSEQSAEQQATGGDGDIRPYDPNTQRRVVRERLQALEIINERFARQFRMGLFNLLRRSGHHRGGDSYSALPRVCPQPAGADQP